MKHGTLPVVLVLLGGAFVAACGPTIPQLRKKAAVDLNCPEFELTVETGKAGKMWVTGCGREGAYKKHCEKGDDGKKTCGWTPIENPEPEH